MKRSLLASLLSSGALLAALAPAASHAQAFDGQIRFTGKVSPGTCKVNGQAAGLGNIKSVDLGTYKVADLASTALNAKVAASEKPFTIELTDCDFKGSAAIAFDQVAAHINRASGNLLINTTLPATGLEIGIWNNGNNKSHKFNLGHAEADVQKIDFDPTHATTPTFGGKLEFLAAYIKVNSTITNGSAGSDIGFLVAYQ